jgi:putative spermidine/putrescine transport system substrate-binding protein
VKGAPHPGPAQKFIDFMLRADIQARCAEGIFYAPANKTAMVRKELAATIPHGPEAVAALIKLDRVVMNRDLDNWIEQWNKIIESKP